MTNKCCICGKQACYAVYPVNDLKKYTSDMKEFIKYYCSKCVPEHIRKKILGKNNEIL